jgi:hypothetical protein
MIMINGTGFWDLRVLKGTRKDRYYCHAHVWVRAEKRSRDEELTETHGGGEIPYSVSSKM